MRIGNYEVENNSKEGRTAFIYRPIIKVIDLLNELANGEKTPKYIKYTDRLNGVENVMLVCKENIIYRLNQCSIELNDEVEVMGEDPEDKEITEHHDIFDYFTGYSFGETNKELLQQLEHNFQIVNEELDYLINKINS